MQIIYSKGNHDMNIGWAFIQMPKERYGDMLKISHKRKKCITYGTNFIGIFLTVI